VKMSVQANSDDLFQPWVKTGKQTTIERPSLSYMQEVVRKLAKNKLAMVGLVLIFFIFVMAIIGPSLVPYSFAHQSLLDSNMTVSAEHWFGTDDLGRDMFARTWYGARISLTIVIVAALIDLVIGVTVGGIAGYMAGRGKNYRQPDLYDTGIPVRPWKQQRPR